MTANSALETSHIAPQYSQSVFGYYVAQGLIGAGLAIAFIPSFGPWGLLSGWLLGLIVASAIPLSMLFAFSGMVSAAAVFDLWPAPGPLGFGS